MPSLFYRIIATITPYIATASQKITEIRFLDMIRFILIAEPTMLTPVIKIPLKMLIIILSLPSCSSNRSAKYNCETDKCPEIRI